MALLHRDDSELILFVDPDEECEIIVQEDTPAFRPISIESNSFKESITLLEEEMIFNKSFSVFL